MFLVGSIMSIVHETQGQASSGGGAVKISLARASVAHKSNKGLFVRSIASGVIVFFMPLAQNCPLCREMHCLFPTWRFVANGSPYLHLCLTHPRWQGTGNRKTRH